MSIKPLFDIHTLRSLEPLLVLALIAIAGIFIGLDALRFDREAIELGQWWRLLSCNIAHLGYRHLLLNLAGLVLVALLFGGHINSRQWSVAIVFTCIATGLCLFLFEPQIRRYVGLSGMLHGVMVYAAVLSWSKQRMINSAVLLIVFGKLLKELIWGPGDIEAFVGGTVLIMSHVYGALSGLLLASISLLIAAIKKPAR